MSMTANDPVRFIYEWNSATSECEEVYGNYTRWQQDLRSTCCPAPGLLLPGTFRTPIIAVFWVIVLCWIFLGVSLGADTFMASIEVITSKERTIKKVDAHGKAHTFHVRIWNATLANLTLMALGSSAPEILLSVFEVVIFGNFNNGELGPSTIVGSAAFNLFIISAVCISCLPAGEVRVIKQKAVFLTTAAFSVLSYIWLLIIVCFWTKEVITVLEGVLTIVFFLLLLTLAYFCDTRIDATANKILAVGTGHRATLSDSKVYASAIKEAGLSSEATPEEIREALKQPFKSKTHYRKMAKSSAPMGKHAKVQPAMKLSDLSGDSHTSPSKTSSVPVDPESAGCIKWQMEQVAVRENAGSVTLYVTRVGGSKGEVKVNFATKNQEAVAGKDYKAEEGTITFTDGDVTAKPITIMIVDDDKFENGETFTVVLSNATGGCSFDSNTDGGSETEVCTVTIISDDDRKSKLESAINLLALDTDALDVATDDWGQQLRDIFVLEGDAIWQKCISLLNFPWKLMFGILPPPGLLGGWPCFFFALLGIGFQVILINDFASQMGCQMYLKKTVTAITFVALGTSLPDTFASKQAAVGDRYADNSIGNVTGSNSVNVLLGLGIPWLIGAIYWQVNGHDASWDARFHPTLGSTPLSPEIYNQWKSTGAFVVLSGDLGFAVIIFSSFAIITIGLILLRRSFGQELGGNVAGARASAVFLVVLWILYVLFSSLASYGFIQLKF